MDLQKRIRVLYVGGWGRSGSTLLERMLGQISGIVATGEVREIWQRGLKEDRPCGCGQRFRACDFWSAVGEEAYGGWDQLDLERILQLRFSLDRPWSYPELGWELRTDQPHGRVAEYQNILHGLYRAIADVSGADVIVDSSKIPTQGLLLSGISAIDLRVLHLVRDSRGVAFSWAKRVEKKVPGQDGYFLPRYGALESAGRWLVYNLMASRLRVHADAYRFLRYEDLHQLAGAAPDRHPPSGRAGRPWRRALVPSGGFRRIARRPHGRRESGPLGSRSDSSFEPTTNGNDGCLLRIGHSSR